MTPRQPKSDEVESGSKYAATFIDIADKFRDVLPFAEEAVSPPDQAGPVIRVLGGFGAVIEPLAKNFALVDVFLGPAAAFLEMTDSPSQTSQDLGPYFQKVRYVAMGIAAFTGKYAAVQKYYSVAMGIQSATSIFTLGTPAALIGAFTLGWSAGTIIDDWSGISEEFEELGDGPLSVEDYPKATIFDYMRRNIEIPKEIQDEIMEGLRERGERWPAFTQYPLDVRQNIIESKVSELLKVLGTADAFAFPTSEPSEPTDLNIIPLQISNDDYQNFPDPTVPSILQNFTNFIDEQTESKLTSDKSYRDYPDPSIYSTIVQYTIDINEFDSPNSTNDGSNLDLGDQNSINDNTNAIGTQSSNISALNQSINNLDLIKSTTDNSEVTNSDASNLANRDPSENELGDPSLSGISDNIAPTFEISDHIDIPSPLEYIPVSVVEPPVQQQDPGPQPNAPQQPQ